MGRVSKMTWITKRSLLNLVLIILFFFQLGTNVASYLQIRHLLEVNEWVLHTQQVIYSISNLWNKILEMQTYLREYVVTQNAIQAEKYSEANQLVFEQINQLMSLTKSNRYQFNHLKTLHALLKQQVTFFDEIITVRKNHGEEPARDVLASEKALYYTNEIHELVTALHDHELLLLDVRNKTYYDNSGKMLYYLALANIMALLLILLFFFLFNWQYTQTLRMEKSLQLANDKLMGKMTESKNHSQAISLLNLLSSTLQSCLTIHETFVPIATYSPRILPRTAGMLYLANPSRNYLDFAVLWGQPGIEEKIIASDQCWALRRGQIHRFYDSKTSIACNHSTGPKPLPASLCIPLQAQNDNVGLLYLQFLNTDRTEADFNQIANQQKSLIITFAEALASAIANIRLRETLRVRSIRDPLTGLYNRSYLEESFEREVQRANRSNSSLAVVMLDLDHFKRVNDAHGHEAGDLILAEVAKILLREIRKTDIACRYGGEEILLLMVDIRSQEEIYHRIEALRQLISNLTLIYHGKTLANISASFGVALMPEHGDTQSQLIEAADRALYFSKKNGRNQVTVAK